MVDIDGRAEVVTVVCNTKKNGWVLVAKAVNGQKLNIFPEKLGVRVLGGKVSSIVQTTSNLDTLAHAASFLRLQQTEYTCIACEKTCVGCSNLDKHISQHLNAPLEAIRKLRTGVVCSDFEALVESSNLHWKVYSRSYSACNACNTYFCAPSKEWIGGHDCRPVRDA